MTRFRSFVFPLALALILGGLSAWLGRISEVTIEEVRLNPTEPQYSMMGIEGRRYDAQGNLNQLLTASSAWQLPDRKNVFLSEPVFTLFQQDKAQYGVTSEIARYEIASKKVFFDHDVVLTKTEDNERPAAKVQTDNLEVDTQTQIAQTQALVEYQYGLSHGTANGFSYDNKNEVLNFPKKVRALVYGAK